MTTELVRQGGLSPTPTTGRPLSRQYGREVQAIRHEVGIAAVKVEGTFALAGLIKHEAVGALRDSRRQSDGDPALEMACAAIDAQALYTAGAIQQNLYR